MGSSELKPRTWEIRELCFGLTSLGGRKFWRGWRIPQKVSGVSFLFATVGGNGIQSPQFLSVQLSRSHLYPGTYNSYNFFYLAIVERKQLLATACETKVYMLQITRSCRFLQQKQVSHFLPYRYCTYKKMGFLKQNVLSSRCYLPMISRPLLSISSTQRLTMIGTKLLVLVAMVIEVATPPGTPPVKFSLFTTVSRSVPNIPATFENHNNSNN